MTKVLFVCHGNICRSPMAEFMFKAMAERAGRAEEIRRCVRCNKRCLGGMMAHQGVHCIYEERKKIK